MEPPPPPSGICSTQSPRSPPRKRRPGMHSARAVATLRPAPVIPPQFQPPFFALPPATASVATLYALQCSFERQHALTNIASLILDTGANISVSNCTADFVTPIQPVQQTTLQGIAAGLSIKGLGIDCYIVRDDYGGHQERTISDVLYVPECPSRLLCPRQLLASTKDLAATMSVHSHGVMLSRQSTAITVPYHQRSYLPILTTAPSIACYHTYCQLHQHHATSSATTGSGTATSPSSADPCPALSPAQRTKLLCHRRLNHVNFDQLTAWMRSGFIPVSKSVTNAPSPLCVMCQYGKAQRRMHHSSTGVIGANHDRPGAGVSANQLEAGGLPRINAHYKGVAHYTAA
jgi:hypothetical protein